MSKKRYSRGDTIVEVLIAMAIASFAIGISYATALRSLQQAITASEHNQALNILENQLTDLQLRFRDTPAATYEQQFGNAWSVHDYCLNDYSSSPSDAVNQWTPYGNDSSATTTNNLGTALAANLAPTQANPFYYDPSKTPPAGCQKQSAGAGAVYFIDIHTSPSGVSQSPTLYHVIVRWYRIGGQINQASIFYKLDGDRSQPLTYSIGPNQLAYTALARRAGTGGA